jgi:uncharacterized protein YggE
MRKERKMKRNLLIPGILLVVFSLLAGIGIALTALPEPAAAQTDQRSIRTIQVSGQGEVSVEPDQAVVRVGVQTEAETAGAALQENNERMTAVISATLEAGIEETDIQTQNFNLQPIYQSPEPDQSPELTGYRASNIVRVTVRDLAQLGTLLDAAVTAGSNTVEGIQFQVSNQARVEAAAREAAIQDAQQKAQQMTELLGAELGPVQTILETGGASPLPVDVIREESLEAGVPVQPGTQFIQVSVQITWEIQ